MVIYKTIGTLGLGCIAQLQKEKAKRVPYFGTESEKGKLDYCSFFLWPYDAHCILTLDLGMHSSGWFKNPDYEACWHLSLSFLDRETGAYAPHDHKKATEIVGGLFETAKNLVWAEPPYTAEGKQSETWHYRVFIDRATCLPMLPRGEVYTREFTEKGWRSFSEMNAQTKAEEKVCEAKEV